MGTGDRQDGGRGGRKGARPAPPPPRETLKIGWTAPPAEAEQPFDRKLFRISGLPAVQALFANDPDRVERLFFDDRMKVHMGAACARLAELRRPYRLVEGEELERVAGSVMHGGVVAVARPRPILTFEVEMAKDWAAAGDPLMLLDGVSNPHNLGAIVRTAAFFGLKRLILADHPSQALPSEAAYRIAEGGFEHVEIYRANGFPGQVHHLGNWYRTIGTALGAPAPLNRLSGGARPVAVVLGNEEHGISDETRRACTEVATIPGGGAVQSLNVSATAAILVYEMMR